MYPRYKYQQLALDLSREIKDIPRKEITKAYDLFGNHYAIRSKGIIRCLSCQTQWPESEPKTQCPNCKRNLKINTTRRRVFRQSFEVTFFETYKDHQVVRVIYFQSNQTRTEKLDVCFEEVLQCWISKKGKISNVAYASQWQHGKRCWQLHSWCGLRNPYYPHRDLLRNIYPCQDFLPELFRNGFLGEFHGIDPQIFFALLLSSPPFETLLKSRRYNWLKFIANHYRKVKKLWPLVRICIRHKNDLPLKSRIWMDYIEMAEMEGKVLTNPAVLFPKNLQEEHDRLVLKYGKGGIVTQTMEERYRKAKLKYLGLFFREDEIEIKPIQTVCDFRRIGTVLVHCIFSNKFYAKTNSLILSATIENKLIETIEVDLESFQILQCHGKGHNPSEYHDRIIALTKENLPVIRSIRNNLN